MKVCTRCHKRQPIDNKKMCQVCTERSRHNRHNRKKRAIIKGICTRCCSRPNIDGLKYCEICRGYLQRSQNKTRKKLTANNICHSCRVKECITKTLCKDCRESEKVRCKQKGHKLKFDVISAYSPTRQCVCCCESNLAFLTIDHINNNGNSHRRSLFGRNGGKIYPWLKKHNFPPGYQVMCFNCNIGKGQNGGICPHKIDSSIIDVD